MQRAVLRKKWQAVQIDLSKWKYLREGRAGFNMQNFPAIRPHRNNTDCLDMVCSTSSICPSNSNKRLEEGSVGAAEPDDHSDDDRNRLKTQGPQLSRMEMVSPNASGLSHISHLCIK